ncbi:MAG: PAS domain S-box protein [Bacteroidota bacterium]|nr:PAS domain S-box protein [Bacteroidota bacterium]MDX5430674.1 PAS domain S-box protein [Bacteroidota bacterium]MDX5469421.1 PAS domain S-box protein [Bacteroidota bacterium]
MPRVPDQQSVRSELNILGQSTLPIAICRKEGDTLYLNEAFETYFREGWKGEENLSERFVNEDSWQQVLQSIEKTGDWDSYAILGKNNGDEIVLKVKACALHFEGEEALIFYFSETNEARRRIFRQGQLLKASSVSSTRVISGEDFIDSLRQVAETLGKAVQADRCYIFESTFLPDSDQIYATPVTQWTRFADESQEGQIGMISYTIFPDFYETLLRDEAYTKTQENLEGHSRKYLESRRIQSLVCLPIFKDKTLWGFMGFDDCSEPREWDDQELASLKLLTNSLSSVLSNTQLKSELEKKNIQLESAIRGSKDSLWDYDVQKERIYYSPQFMEMIGYKEDELDGSISDLKQFVFSRDLYKIFKGLNFILQSGKPIRDFELRLKDKNNELIWVRISARPSFDLSGNVLRISGTSTNITLEKTYEKKIAESQEKYIELVDNLREVVIQLNLNGKTEFLSQGWTHLTGHPIKNMIGKPFRESILEDDRTKFDALMDELSINKNAYLNCMVRIPSKDNKIKWTEIYARSIFRKDNKPYFLGTIIDVSQRRLTEQKLEESETRYRLITENISDMVTLQDETGKFIYASPSIQTILGFSPDEIIGKSPRQIWTEKQVKNTVWEKDLFDTKQGLRSSYLFSKKNGQSVWLETLRSLVYTENEDRFVIQSTTRDISPFKEAEQNLKAALDKQRELNDLKSNFISMASHEFRTPLTTIRSSIQLLEEYSRSTPEEQKLKMQKHFVRTKDQIERVTRLMNDVLILGRFDAGKTPFHAKASDLGMFCKELIAEHFSNQSDGRTIQISIEGDSKPVIFDSSLLSHVVLNLVSNAFKYSIGKKNPELEIKYDESHVRLIVRDFGIGIPKDDLNLVFQSFYRAKNAIEVPGTGLGLVITKEFVELHKGSIQITSELNNYTEVCVELPL